VKLEKLEYRAKVIYLFQ